MTTRVKARPSCRSSRAEASDVPHGRGARAPAPPPPLPRGWWGGETSNSTIAIFRDDGYSLPGGIVIDLLALRYTRFDLHLAHEFHHTFVDRLAPLPAGSDTAADAGLRTALHYLRSEGIADLIDKPYPFTPSNPGLAAYARRYNAEYPRTREALRSFDALLRRVASGRASLADLGMDLQMAFWSNGHPNGAFIAREIRETFGDDSIRAAAANPARFLRIFTAA